MKFVLSLLTGMSALALSFSVGNATTIFSDSTFNSADYTATSFHSSPFISISHGQCVDCGNPNDGLQILTLFGVAGTADLALLNKNFVYNPTNQGAITSVSASVDKSLASNLLGSTNSFFRPIVEQGGVTYAAAIQGADFVGNGSLATTGYINFSSALTSSDFTAYDFATGVGGASHPNFAGGALEFGIGQISTVGALTFTSIEYDNLAFNVSSVSPVPLPPALPMFGAALLGLVMIGFSSRYRARNNDTSSSVSA